MQDDHQVVTQFDGSSGGDDSIGKGSTAGNETLHGGAGGDDSALATLVGKTAREASNLKDDKTKLVPKLLDYLMNSPSQPKLPQGASSFPQIKLDGKQAHAFIRLAKGRTNKLNEERDCSKSTFVLSFLTKNPAILLVILGEIAQGDKSGHIKWINENREHSLAKALYKIPVIAKLCEAVKTPVKA